MLSFKRQKSNLNSCCMDRLFLASPRQMVGRLSRQSVREIHGPNPFRGLVQVLSRLIVIIVIGVGWHQGVAQSLTFHIQGDNPFCVEDYPNGANYNGVASVSGLFGQILKVDFQMQYKASGGQWNNWGQQFTIVPWWGSHQVHYNQSTSGAPPMTMSPKHHVRMRARITYSVWGEGTESVTVFSHEREYNRFPAPVVDFTVDGNPVSMQFPLLVYTCDGHPVLETTGSSHHGSGRMFRFSAFHSDASGNQGQPLAGFEDCWWLWAGGQVLATMPVNNPYGLPPDFGVDCAGDWSQLDNEYVLIRLEIQNDCGYHVKEALLHVFQSPGAAQVDFYFKGSPQADGQYSGPNDRSPLGEQNPATGNADDGDGVLSWGGTFANPTPVGAALTVLAIEHANFYKGLDSWKMEIDYRQENDWFFAGEYVEYNPNANELSINQVPISINGGADPPQQGYFISHWHAGSTGVLGKTFRVTLTGYGVCDQAPSKQGYFTILDDAIWWLQDPGQGNNAQVSIHHDEVVLSLWPNPASDRVHLDISVPQATRTSWMILDMQGRTMPVPGLESQTLDPGFNRLDVPTSHLTPGMYIIRLTTEREVHSTMFVKH